MAFANFCPASFLAVDLGVRCLELYLGAKEGLFHHIRNYRITQWWLGQICGVDGAGWGGYTTLTFWIRMGWKVDFLANFQVVRVLDLWVGAQKVISLNTQAICHLVETVLPELGRFNPVSMLVTRRFAFDAVKVHENVKHGSLLVLLSDQVGLCCQAHIRNGAFFATLERRLSPIPPRVRVGRWGVERTLLSAAFEVDFLDQWVDHSGRRR